MFWTMKLARRGGLLGAGRAVFLGAALVVAPFASADTAPQRVVSINLCTDQLAMMLAGPGQLISVSYIGADPMASAMAVEAQAYPLNHAQGEEVFRLAPDLVLAGTFSSTFTLGLLRRLGIEVAQFAPERSFDDLRANVRAMGAVLHREDAAEALLAQFEADLAAVRVLADTKPEALMHYANNYTSGDASLAHEIVAAAGWSNAAVKAGFRGGAVPMELLVMLTPDLVISSQPYPGASRAEEVLRHPAMMALREGTKRSALSDAEWVCGTPHVLRAVARLAALHPEGGGQ
jgi:iron complex transport system substrate-binding protein